MKRKQLPPRHFKRHPRAAEWTITDTMNVSKPDSSFASNTPQGAILVNRAWVGVVDFHGTNVYLISPSSLEEVRRMKRPLLSFTLLSLLMSLGCAWTTPGCTIADSSLLSNISYYIPFCPLAPGLQFFASCSHVNDLAQTLAVLPSRLEALCLQGTVQVLSANAFGRFPILKLLRLQLGPIRVTSGAFQGVTQLQHLFFEHPAPCCLSLFLPADALQPFGLLRSLSFEGYCLNSSHSIQLPLSLSHLTMRHSCMTDLQELKELFPSLVPDSSPIGSSSSWSPFLEVLDLSANLQLRQVDARALQGLQLHSLRLESTPLNAGELLGTGLLHLDSLSLVDTGIKKLPRDVTANFELCALDLGRNQIQSIEDDDLPGCHSLEHLNLHANSLHALPTRFFSALPQLQRLNLSMNQLGPTLVLPAGPVSSNLSMLDLSLNGLRALPARAFFSLPQLQELWLGGNNISHLSSEMLGGLRWLKTLDLNWNQIKVLEPGWLASLPALTSLTLLGTHIENFSGRLLQGPQQLSHLQLGAWEFLTLYNPWPSTLLSLELRAEIVEFKFSLREAFLSLENLALQAYWVLPPPTNTTFHFPSLRHFTLRGCPSIFSSHHTYGLFPQLPLLEHLHFWSDPQEIEHVQLSGLPRLRVLELGDVTGFYPSNQMKLEEILMEVPQLEVLALSNVNLEDLSVSSFRDLRFLRLLLLNSERVLGLNRSLQELIPQMPQYVYFSDVIFKCQCENSWVEPWAARTPNTFVYGLENSICMVNGSDRSKTPFLSFLSAYCLDDLEFQSFLTSFTLVLLLTSFALLGGPNWPWLHHLWALCRAWWLKMGGWHHRSHYVYDVFISYCGQDQAWVLAELIPALEKPFPDGEGLRLCLPERDFGVGQDRIDAMASSMESSRATLCVLSRHALGSPWSNLELRLATYHMVAKPGTARLLLLFLEPIDRRQLCGYHRLARWLQQEDYLDFPKRSVDWEAFWSKLRKRLRKAVQEREA
ncbi:toll-like receptor 11 [Echinops telfairi]|uniref:Toll-like receptor 11 n=1 Tax=Echinops telfairi TaxID=9371 RepID=A0ABM0IFM1_ECHTE|nr:toll-like receptor 11 [Echinops telfairi]